jgi:hypothetical protein
VSGAVGISVEDVDDAISFEPVGTSAVLAVTAEHPDPAVAQQLAASASEQLLALLLEGGSETAELERVLEGLEQARVAESEVEAGLRGLEQQRAATPQGSPIPTAEERALEAELRQLINRRAQLESRQLALELDQTRQRPPQLVTEAYVLAKPVSPVIVRDTLIGTIIGIGIAGLLALALWWRRHRDDDAFGAGPARAG